MNTCLVFGGGGGKGAYQIGVWEALKEWNKTREIDTVIGTSVGALNAALFCQNNFTIAKNTWEAISNNIIFTKGNFGKNPSVLSYDGLSSIINIRLSENFINASKIRCYVCATCTDSIEDSINNRLGSMSNNMFLEIAKSKVYSKYFCINEFNKSKMQKALLASAALPGAFGYVEIDGHKYRDGGIIHENNLPYQKAIDMGYKKIIAVSLDNGVSRIENIKGAKILFIHPSRNLGDLFGGTVDFSSEGARWRMKLGYSDMLNHKDKVKQVIGVSYEANLFTTQEEVNRIFS
ncbi:MAG: hypothetical protein E7265_02835 [Lachnospiraceae bacterium]|nr:hypothetical protein [Lachnospiraceae bacterium]